MTLGLNSFIAILFAANLTAWIVDLLPRRVDTTWWKGLDAKNWYQTIQVSSGEFLKIFDTVYSDDWKSWRRIWRAYLSSLFAIGVVSCRRWRSGDAG